MSQRDIKGRVLQIISIVRASVGEFISVDSLLRYDQPRVFDNDRDIVDKGYVDNASGSIKTTVTGNQSDTVVAGGISAPYLDEATIWSANYTQDGATYWISESMLNAGTLYGFPDSGNFTYKINYI